MHRNSVDCSKTKLFFCHLIQQTLGLSLISNFLLDVRSQLYVQIIAALNWHWIFILKLKCFYLALLYTLLAINRIVLCTSYSTSSNNNDGIIVDLLLQLQRTFVQMIMNCLQQTWQKTIILHHFILIIKKFCTVWASMVINVWVSQVSV